MGHRTPTTWECHSKRQAAASSQILETPTLVPPTPVQTVVANSWLGKSGSVAGSARTLVDPVQCNVFFFHRPSTLSKKTDHAGEHLLLTCDGTPERDIIADRTTATPTRLSTRNSMERRLGMLEGSIGRGNGIGGKWSFDSAWRRSAQIWRVWNGLSTLEWIERRVSSERSFAQRLLWPCAKYGKCSRYLTFFRPARTCDSLPRRRSCFTRRHDRDFRRLCAPTQRFFPPRSARSALLSLYRFSFTGFPSFCRFVLTCPRFSSRREFLDPTVFRRRRKDCLDVC